MSIKLENTRSGQEAERVFQALKAQILDGDLPSGTKLNEKILSIALGTSRGSLREAIRRLQERELVSWQPNAGTRVRVHTPEDVIESYYVREALEGMAARLAAEHITEAELAELKRAVDAREELHMIIVRASRNERLNTLIGERHFELLRKFRNDFPQMQSGGDDSYFEHEMLYHALAQRDGDLAETIMRRHIVRIRKSLTSRFRAAASDTPRRAAGGVE